MGKMAFWAIFAHFGPFFGHNVSPKPPIKIILVVCVSYHQCTSTNTLIYLFDNIYMDPNE